jgi:branched-chain amino acid transport system substrate-binding protein
MKFFPRSMSRVLMAFAAMAGLGTAQAQISVGLVGPMSGPAAIYGTEPLAGARFALDELVAAGNPVARQIKLIPADSTANPGIAAQAAERMVSSDKVVAIIGGMTSAETQAMVEVTRKARVVQLSPLAQDNSLTQQKNEWFYRIAQNADSFGMKAAEWAADKLKAKRVFVLARNDNYGQSNAESFIAGLKAKGLQATGQASYEPNAKDFRPILQKVADAKPDLVAIMGFYTDAGLIVKQMNEMQIKANVYANTAPGLPQFADIAGPASRGVYGALYYFAGSVASESGKKFVDAWTARHKRAPSQYEGMGYDAMRVLVHALQTLPDPAKATSDQLRVAIGKVSGYEGATGRITFQPTGDAERPLPIVRLGDQGLVLDTLVQ